MWHDVYHYFFRIPHIWKLECEPFVWDKSLISFDVRTAYCAVKALFSFTAVACSIRHSTAWLQSNTKPSHFPASQLLQSCSVIPEKSLIISPRPQLSNSENRIQCLFQRHMKNGVKDNTLQGEESQALKWLTFKYHHASHIVILWTQSFRLSLQFLFSTSLKKYSTFISVFTLAHSFLCQVLWELSTYTTVF